jgi:transposase
VADWYAQTMLVHKLGVAAAKLNDDRLARTLDALAPHCRDIWLAVVSRAVARYDIDLHMLFYDLSAFVAQGEYTASDLVAFGFAHNTPIDKRKLKLGLNVSADGNIPVDYWPWAGNTADKATVERNLQRLCKLLRHHGWPPNQVLLLGDRAMLDDKLALLYGAHQIRYLAGLQPQKKVHVNLVQDTPEDAFYRTPLTPARGSLGDWGVPVAVPFAHAGQTVSHRGLVVLSGPMRSALARTRAKHFRKLWQALRIIQDKAAYQKPRYRRAQDVQVRAATQLRNSPVGQFVSVCVTEAAGGPQLHWQVRREELVAAMQQDGRYLLVTNDPTLTPPQMLACYRDKDGVEKRFTVCKQDLKISPIYLHQDQRIEAMLLLNMLALLTYSILERQMRQHGLQLTTRRLIAQLETLCVIETYCRDGSVLYRLTPLTPEQTQLVQRLDAVLQVPGQRIMAWAHFDRPDPPSAGLLTTH